ncbi:MAG: hypothetical protein AAGA42_06720 [Actinomycetota bacterium]
MDDRDLDELFERSSQPVRPSARFEEELLVRMESAYDEGPDLDEAVGASGESPDSFELDPTALGHDGRHGDRAGSRRLLAVAAVVLLLVAGAALVIVGGDRSADEEPVVSAPDTPFLDAINDACERTLPAVQSAFPTFDELPGGPGDDPTLAIAPLRTMIDALADALASAPPSLGALRVEVADLDGLLADQELLVEVDQVNSVRAALPLIAERLVTVTETLADAGATACAAEQDDP